MSTPPILVELKCRCGLLHWEIDRDYRGMYGEEEPYNTRVYTCPECGFQGSGFTVIQKSPSEFFLQPHDMYPMKIGEFLKWIRVLRKHFPNHPSLKLLWWCWYPGKKKMVAILVNKLNVLNEAIPQSQPD